MGAAGICQMRPGADYAAGRTSLTSAYMPEREPWTPTIQVVVLDVVGSSPIVHPNVRHQAPRRIERLQ
jgi:hypothetical protein